MAVAAAAPWGGRGAGGCAGAHLFRGPLVSLDWPPRGSCHPLLTQRGLGLQNQLLLLSRFYRGPPHPKLLTAVPSLPRGRVSVSGTFKTTHLIFMTSPFIH